MGGRVRRIIRVMALVQMKRRKTQVLRLGLFLRRYYEQTFIECFLYAGHRAEFYLSNPHSNPTKKT